VADNFGQVAEMLFEVRVLAFNRLDPHGGVLGVEPFLSLRIFPRDGIYGAVHVNRSIPAEGYWDEPASREVVAASEVSMIGFFDWDPYGFLEMKFLRGLIVQSPAKELEGREVLVEASYARVVAI
jgi:hypothetical protein